MTPKRVAALKAALAAMRADALRAGPVKIEPNRKDDGVTGVADEDAQALSEMLQTLASQRNRKQADLLARIDVALRRIAESPDEVGLCEDCEEPIPAKRLTLLPYATLCAECQAKCDPRRGVGRRNLTDLG